MKKKLMIGAISIIVLIGGIVFLGSNNSGREKTLESAIGISESSLIRVIHEEKTKKGSIIFCTNDIDEEKYIYTAFVNKNLYGYKELYSGASSITGIEKRGLNSVFFPAIKDTDLPIYFGVIGNDEIAEVKIREGNNSSSEWKNAKVINTDDMRIWLMYMDEFKGSQFDIGGFNDKGEEIFRTTDTTAWPADQKPMESHY